MMHQKAKGAAIVLTSLCLLAPAGCVTVVATFMGDEASACDTDGGMPGGNPTALAEDAIPANLMPIYRAAEEQYGVPWNVLAAINKVETDFGHNLNVSSAGAVGWMQFMPATWAAYGVDANGDGHKDPYDPEDAIFAAANYLKASGAPQKMREAIWAYNHADWYVNDVLEWAGKFSRNAVLGDAVPSGGSCAVAEAGVPGKVEIAPGANNPGEPIKPFAMEFFERVAGIYGKPIIITTGTAHSYTTANGNVSEHVLGQAADFGSVPNKFSSVKLAPEGYKLAAAALQAAGKSPAEAASMARIGQIHNVIWNGFRIQIIWGCDGLGCGGDHTDHVHIGVKPLNPSPREA